jgi:hypothetical protein
MDDDVQDAAVETYLQVRVEDDVDPLDVQARLAKIPRYIGSFTVDTEQVGDGEAFAFHVAVGFNGTVGEVDAAVEASRTTEGVADIRETRNRSPRPLAALAVEVEVVVEEIIVEVEAEEPPEGV